MIYLHFICVFLLFEVKWMKKMYTYSTELEAVFDNQRYPEVGDLPLLNHKIFRGNAVPIIEHPYIVSIRRNFGHYLPAVILTKNCLITVAHPIIDVPLYELNAVASESYADRGTLLLTIIFLIIHENFDPYTLSADIALLRLYEELIFRVSVKPIALIGSNENINESKAFVTGWGRCDWTIGLKCLPRSLKHFPGETFDPILKSISFTLETHNHHCEEYKKHDNKILPGMLCGGGAREDDALMPCLAVPGSPLVVNGHLAGLQSWGLGCAYKHDLPLIYTDINYYGQWLKWNVEILRLLKKENLTQLYKASEAYSMIYFLKHTRKYKPVKLQHHNINMDMEPLEIDKILAFLNGSVYDIRDFINNTETRTFKSKMYEAYKQQIYTYYKHANMFRFTGTLEPRPFIKNLDDIDFSFNMNEP